MNSKLGRKSLGISLGLVGMLFLFFAQSASAQLVAFTNQHVPQSWGGAGDKYFALSGAQRIFRFTTNEPKILLITVSAQCGIAANDNYHYVDLDVIVDGSEVYGTRPDNAFCSSHGVPNAAHPSTNSVIGQIWVPAGTHELQLRGKILNYKWAQAMLQNISVAIQD